MLTSAEYWLKSGSVHTENHNPRKYTNDEDVVEGRGRGHRLRQSGERECAGRDRERERKRARAPERDSRKETERNLP